MDPLTMTAAGGLRARMESLELLANNLANSETAGYKTDREFYDLYLAPEQNDAGAGDPTTMPVIERNYTDHSQGVLRATANPLDLALDGRGFFAVESNGQVAYTRNGAFHLNSAGNLVTADGYALRSGGANAKPLQVNPALPFTVTPDGTIKQSGAAVGQIAVVDFANSGELSKQGNTRFAADRQAQTRPAAAEVHQGKLENSNVGTAESAVRLVSVMRQFEHLQKAIHIGSEMNRKAVEEVARVNS
jgi:flagellar basal-body rod protein FlgF